MSDPLILARPPGPASVYLTGLNDAQRRAVEALDGPVLVLSGAGTGKTRVLTARLAHILATGRAFPGELLAVTFTNKAAREMRARLDAMTGRAADGVWLGTFHAIAARILRRHAETVGLKSSFTILDTDDQLRLAKQIIEAENIDERRWPARLLLALIQRWKDRGLGPDQVPRADSGKFADGRAVELYRRYQERLLTVNAVDFGDLLLHNLALFTGEPFNPCRLPAAVPLSPGRRVPGYERRPIFVAAALGAAAAQPVRRRRRRSVDLQLAGCGNRQHPALRKGFSGGGNHPARAELPFDAAHPWCGERHDRPQSRPARQAPMDRCRRRRQGRGPGIVGRRGGGALGR